MTCKHCGEPIESATITGITVWTHTRGGGTVQTCKVEESDGISRYHRATPKEENDV